MAVLLPAAVTTLSKTTLFNVILYSLTISSLLVGIVDASTAAGQDTLVGIVGKDFVLLGADSSCSLRGTIALTASNVDKIYVISDPGGQTDVQQERPQKHYSSVATAVAGNPADYHRLLGLLRAHAAIREYENSVGCDVECVFEGGSTTTTITSTSTSDHLPLGLDARALAHLARVEISSSLRTAAPLQMCLLVAGMSYDDGEAVRPSLQPCLYWLDNTGFMQRVPYGTHGYGSNFLWSILDRDYKPNMSKEDACSLLKSCFEQLRTRYVINTGPNPPIIKCLDAVNGCTTVQ